MMEMDSAENHTDDVDGASHHVHFSEDTDELGHTYVMVKEKQSLHYEVHVGFLQINHKYKIVFELPVTNSSKGYSISELSTNVFCHPVNLQAMESGTLEITLELLAHKEKLLREKVQLRTPSDEHITLTVLARVLGKGKGTPMLLNGVQCISAVAVDDESEASDWQGFS